MQRNANVSGTSLKNSTKGIVTELDPQSAAEAARMVGQLDLSYCFQCGVCSGSCPTIGRMEYGPRKIMHMIQLGMLDRVLRSPDIWLCVSCYLCAARCPQAIEITDVMGVLRNMSVARSLTKDKEAIFSETFLTVIKEHGYMYEPELLVRYYASVLDVPSIVKIAPLGVRMFLKSKIALLPKRMKGPRQLADLMGKVRGRGEL